MLLRMLAGVACVAAVTAFAFAQQAPQTPAEAAKADKPKWDVMAPTGLTTRQINISVDEGTWMDVDVSPDGKTIAFDLLGDIYTMPITGGPATRIAEGLAHEMQPQYSPDGKQIAFTSDRGGGDNIWVMNADGSDKRQVSKEEFRLLNEPAWSPDGRFLAARKHFTTSRSLGTGEIWIYYTGGGEGYAAVKRSNEAVQKELGEPAYTPDGKGIYYTRNITPGNTFEYAEDSNGTVFVIERYDFETGETNRVVSGAGGATRATPSPDGKKLAFVRRERGQSKLYVKDLVSGRLDIVYGALDMDQQEGWAINGLYPTMDWLPDNKTIVFWAGGKIRRVDMAGQSSVIPFSVSDTRTIIDPPRPQVVVAPDEFRTKMPRYVAVSPDGKRVVFESLGKLYTKALPGGAPQRLTGGNGAQEELFPSWSRDGKQIVFVEWTDEGLGKIRIIGSGGGQAKDVTTQPGHYRRPRFSPDGRTVVYQKGTGGGLLSQLWSDNPGIYRVPVAGGAGEKITNNGDTPMFGASNDRVFVTRSEGAASVLVSMDMNGEAVRKHARGDNLQGYEVSPDGRWLSFLDNFAAYVMPLPQGPQDVGAGKSASALSVAKASAGGATYSVFFDGGKQLGWTLGPNLFTASLDAMLPQTPAKDGQKYKAPEAGIDLSIPVKAAKPAGQIALVGARIVTMSNEAGGVIEDGVILVTDNRIAAIGGRGDVRLPAGVRTIDVTGKTIIPGMIDMHSHGAQGDDDIVPQQNWVATGTLAMGVTTIFDPSNSSSQIFPASEMQRAGLIQGPRMFSTAEPVYGARSAGFADIKDYDDALAHIRRLKAQGATAIKNYIQPRRNQRQQVLAAAHAEGIAVVAEGGSLVQFDMTLISDGNTALEHNLPMKNIYADMISLFSQSQVAYTPTLVVAFGGLSGDQYWRMMTDVWTNPILSRHVPPHRLQPNSVRRTKAPDEDFMDQYAAREAKKLADKGVDVTIGAHGQEEGLGSHWELWSFARGGFTPVQAIRTATISAARKLNMDKDIGSLEAGKLADLVILNDNPLADIRNSDHIASVMLNGRLYDAGTLDEIAPGTRKRPKYYWEE